MTKRDIDGEKLQSTPPLPGREEFAPDFSSYGEKREALKRLFRQSEKQKKDPAVSDL